MTRSRRPAALVAAALAAVALSGGATLAGVASGAKTSRVHTVVLSGFAFHPSTLNARAGDRVKFVWKQGLHNIVTVLGPSKINARKITDSRPPLVAVLKHGKYRLICQPHESAGMVITINVR
jgi:plastocyanin